MPGYDAYSVPAGQAIPLTASSSVLFPATHSIFIGSSGDVGVALVGDPDTIRTFKNVPAGRELKVRAVRLASTATTTAGDILGLY